MKAFGRSSQRFMISKQFHLLLCLSAAGLVSAAPPGLESIFPAGGQPGTRVECTVAGKGLETGAPIAWTNHPGLVLLAGDKPKKVIATIAKDVPPGPYLVRFYNDEGSTPPRIWEIGALDEILEKEPNDALADAKAADAKMNITINGVLEKAGDVDTHALRVQKAKRIALALHGYALGSPMDPALRLLDAHGVEIAAGHDTHNLDPRIDYTPTTDGTVFVQVFAFAHPPAADVSLKGSANHVYRLTATDVPPASAPENEPKTLTTPTSFRGRISKPQEEDAFVLTAKKGDEWAISVRAQAIQSPLDAVLRIQDSEGKELTQGDDGKTNLDPDLRWKTPKDGEYKIIVTDRFHAGSADHAYEFSAKPFTPTFTVTLDTHAYRVEAGKSVEVKLKITPAGTFKGKFQAKALQLPPGVTTDTVEIPEKGGDSKLVLKAAADANASQDPFRVELTTSEPDAPQTVIATYDVPFTEPRGDLLIMTDTQPWLTVALKAAAKK